MFNKNQNNCITDASRQGVVVGAKGAWHVCFFVYCEAVLLTWRFACDPHINPQLVGGQLKGVKRPNKFLVPRNVIETLPLQLQLQLQLQLHIETIWPICCTFPHELMGPLCCSCLDSFVSINIRKCQLHVATVRPQQQTGCWRADAAAVASCKGQRGQLIYRDNECSSRASQSMCKFEFRGS